MPDLPLGWTTSSQFCGIRGVTITSKGSQGVKASPEAELEIAPFLSLPAPPSPRCLSCLGLQLCGPWWIRMVLGRCV